MESEDQDTNKRHLDGCQTSYQGYEPATKMLTAKELSNLGLTLRSSPEATVKPGLKRWLTYDAATAMLSTSVCQMNQYIENDVMHVIDKTKGLNQPKTSGRIWRNIINTMSG